ncbi:MAG: ferritin family protein [Deltaproteobacteria bacterium]|jgi:rubrerythrin|nr:ferritin family protein [Deltaproteobacteria bacterium]
MKVRSTDEGIQIYDFNAAEALKIARKLEREGIKFYKEFLETVEDPKVKEVLLYLLDEEMEHLKLFEKMLEREDPESLDDDGEGVLDVVDDGVYTLPKSEALATDLDEAIQLGINIEKRSLSFYLEIVKHTKSEEGKNVLKIIIGEEKNHWEELKRLI